MAGSNRSSTPAKPETKDSEQEPKAPDFGDDYDEAPESTVDDADFDADEQNAKEVTTDGDA